MKSCTECDEQSRLLGMSAERELDLRSQVERLERENAKLRDTQYGSGIIEHLRSKIDWQEAIMRQALDALSDFDYDKRIAAIAVLKEIPK